MLLIQWLAALLIILLPISCLSLDTLNKGWLQMHFIALRAQVYGWNLTNREFLLHRSSHGVFVLTNYD